MDMMKEGESSGKEESVESAEKTTVAGSADIKRSREQSVKSEQNDDKKNSRSTSSEYISLDMVENNSFCDASSGYGTSKTAQQGTSTYKLKKKKRVKECLRELKSLVLPNKETKSGLLHTLQQVVRRMKELKDEKHVDDGGFRAGETEMIGIDLIPGTGRTDNSAQSYSIVMSSEETVVLQVSEELTDMLGYPKNYWLDQSLTDFIRRKDIVTINNSLAEVCMRALSNVGQIRKPSENTFFFALRHYKSLRQGYNLLRSEKFTTFRAQANVVASPGGPSTSTATAPEKKFLLLECVPVYSAYQDKDELPSMRAFSTKQTVFCNYSAVQHQAITLLGYLPQDMIGTSIFKYYHPNDLPMLYEVYEKIVSNPGEKLMSTPYRMRCQNGDYIHVVTEWSSCVNTWTKKWDFIIGKHEVVKGPTNRDVFSDPQITISQSADTCINMDYDAITNHENKIKRLFLQIGEVSEEATTGVKHKQTLVAESTVSRLKESELESGDLVDPHSSPSPDSCEQDDITNCIPRAGDDVHSDKQIIQVNLLPLLQLQFSLSPKPAKQKANLSSPRIEELVEAGRRTSKDKKREGTSSKSRKNFVLSGDRLMDEAQGKAMPGKLGNKEINNPSLSSLLSLCNNDLSLIYEGVNYASNIKRFLLSCPAMVSYNNIHEHEYQPQEGDDESGASCSEEEHLSMDVDFQLPRPPSYASSTKALVSEQEHREELMPPSPSHNEDTGDEMQKESTSEEDYTPVTLTENVLQMHEKIQVQNFLEGVIKEKSAYLMFMPNLSRRRMHRSSRVLQKRQAESCDDTIAPKLRITNDQQIKPQESKDSQKILAPPFPITAIDTKKTMTKPLPGSSGVRGNQLTLSQDLGDKKMGAAKFVTISNLCSVSASCDQLATNTVSDLDSSASSDKINKADPVGGFQWTVCPQTGVPVLQPFMSRPTYYLPKSSLHYNPFGGPPLHGPASYQQPPLPPATATVSRPDQGGSNASMTQESDMDDTGSSLRYLLESGSNSLYQSSPSEKSCTMGVGKSVKRGYPRNKEVHRPYWQQAVNWNKDLTLNYVAPILDRKEVLNSDKAFLRKLKQPTRVVHQLEELLSMQSTSETDVDSDLGIAPRNRVSRKSLPANLREGFPPEEAAGKSTKKADQPPEKVSSGCDGEGSDSSERHEENADCSSPGKGIEKDASENGTVESSDSFEMLTEGSGSGSFPETGSCDQAKSEQSTDKAVENEMDNTSETGSSKGSSDFTPSDQRSHEEMGSSLKESDNASSHSGSSNKAKSTTSSDTKMGPKKPKSVPKKTLSDDIFEQLFLPLQGTRTTDKSNLQPPPWLVDVNFGPQVQMSYQHSLLDHGNTLRQDKIQLMHMTQPDMVFEQMSALRKESRTDDHAEASGSSETKSSENFEHMKQVELRENEEGDSLSSESGPKKQALTFRSISEDVGTMKETLEELCKNRKADVARGGDGLTDSSHVGFGRLQRGDEGNSYDSRSFTSSSASGHKKNESSSSEKVLSSRSDSKHSSASSNRGQGTGSSGSLRGSSENNSDSSGEPKPCKQVKLMSAAENYVISSYNEASIVHRHTSEENFASKFQASSVESSMPQTSLPETYPVPQSVPNPPPVHLPFPQPPTGGQQPDQRRDSFVQFFLPDVFATEEIDFMLED